jgi:hypothetical protein
MLMSLAREIFQQLLLQPHNNQTNVFRLKHPPSLTPDESW